MAECEMLSGCAFFRKYQETLDMACRGFIKTYCTGSKMDECRRKQFRRKEGAPPPEDMLPTGQMMPKSYL